jgi:hypothetical protein
MIDRRRAFRLALAVLPGAYLLRSAAARADQAFQRFLPLFVDLDGWKGNKPDGLTMEMPNNSMTTAKRDYTRGPAQLHASVVVGPAALGALATTVAGMNLETSEGHMISSTIDGFAVARTYNIAQKSGAFLVALGPSALFSVSYNAMTEDEALPLAEKFDWRALQAAAQQK